MLSRFIERGLRGLDRELAAFRHRIAGIDDEVHDYLFQLSRIGFDFAVFGAEVESEFDIDPDQPTNHRAQIGDHLVDTEDLPFHHLLPAEGE